MSQSKVFTGVVWSAIQRFGTMIVSFVANIVLARLLTPDDFGTVGMLMFFISIATTFVDSGFGSALIQKKDATEKDYSTVFVINIVMSSLLYLILFLCAPLISKFYGISILTKILRIQGLTLFINAFTIVQTTILRKNMNFKVLSFANIMGNIGGTIIAIVMALLGCGLWSLVVKSMSVSLIVTIILWIISDWKVNYVFDRQSLKELFGFGGYICLTSLVINFTNNIESLVVGKFYNSSALGQLSQAKSLKSVASESISSVIGQVLYPDFANNQDKDSVIQGKLNDSVHYIAFCTAALMALCILVARPLIIILYGEKWIDSIPMFQILCILGLFYSVQDVNYYIIAAKGRSKFLLSFNVLKMIVFSLMIITTIKLWGLIGMLWSSVIYMFVVYVCYACIASKCLSCSPIKQVAKLLSCTFLGLLCYGISFLIERSFFNGMGNLLTIVFDSFVFLSLYIGLAFLFKSQALKYVVSNLFKIN